MTGFRDGEQMWVERLGNLRNTVRQELIGRQLAAHVRPGSTVLDVGCGQGTQAIRLARLGCAVTGVDPSPELLARARSEAASAEVTIEFLDGELADLARLSDTRSFDVVCGHGLLMYLDDAFAGVQTLADRVGPSGLLSVTFRNRDALAFRPGLRGDWAASLDAFDSDRYVNELGVPAKAHGMDEMSALVNRLGFDVAAWYGVRIFTDPADVEEPVPEADLDALLEVEWIASRRDPYRSLGAQVHLVATRR